MFKTDEKTENDLGFMMEHNVYGEPSGTEAHSLSARRLRWYQRARKPSEWIFILPLLKFLIGIYLQKTQFLLKKKMTNRTSYFYE